MTISLATACSSIMTLQSMEQRREAIEKLPQRAFGFMSAKKRSPDDLVGTKGMPFETFKALVQIYIDHHNTAPETTNNLMVALATVITNSVVIFGNHSPFIQFAKTTAFVNKLMSGQADLNAPAALKLIEACALHHPDFLSKNQKQAVYGLINQHAPQLLPDHFKNDRIREFLPSNIINPDRIIEILHETGEDPVYLAELCLNRDRNAPLAPTTKASSNYNLKQHFIRAGQWHDGPQTCIAVSGKDLEGNEFVVTSNGTLVPVDEDPVKIDEAAGKTLIATRQLGRRISAAQALMRGSPAPGS